MALVRAADQSETVNFCTFLGRNKDIFPGELPTIGYIPGGANMAFIPIKKVYQPKF